MSKIEGQKHQKAKNRRNEEKKPTALNPKRLAEDSGELLGGDGRDEAVGDAMPRDADIRAVAEATTALAAISTAGEVQTGTERLVA